MYIEEIASKEDYLLQLSSLETDTGRRADFDVTLNHDNATREKLVSFLTKRNIHHFIIVDNVVYDSKTVNFGSQSVENTLYLTQGNGKVYRWTKVGVSFIKIGSSSKATCILSNQDAKPYNRRDNFRVPIDAYGSILWSGEEQAESCMVLNVSHGGIGILMDETKVELGIGYPAEITWSETILSDATKQQVSAYIRKYMKKGAVQRVGDTYPRRYQAAAA